MGHNEKTTVAWQTMALSPLGMWGPLGPGQGQRPAGRTRPAVQGACMTYMTVGLQSQKSQLSPQSEVKVSLATRTLPLPGCGGVTEAETGQTVRLPALSCFSEMALLWGQGRAGRLGKAGPCLSEPGAPFSDHFPKAPPFRPLWGTEFLSQP